MAVLASAPRTTVSRLGSHPRSPAFKSFWETSLEYEGLRAPTSGVWVSREKGAGCLPNCSSHSLEWAPQGPGQEGKGLSQAGPQALGARPQLAYSENGGCG